MPTEMDLVSWSKMIGKTVSKRRASAGREPKPFKSGFKVNTVKGLIFHPQLNVPAFTFEEDDSYVECRKCILVDLENCK